MKIISISMLSIVLGLLFSSVSYSGSLYWYVDDEGVTHFASAPEGSGTQSGQLEYQDIPDDSYTENKNGTTTRVIDTSQFNGDNDNQTIIKRSNNISNQNNSSQNRYNQQSTHLHDEDFE